MSGEQIVERNIPYHLISHPAINQGKEGWGFVFLYVHCSETDLGIHLLVGRVLPLQIHPPSFLHYKLPF